MIEPGVYIDKPTGAVLLILGTEPGTELLQFVVIHSDDREWSEESVLLLCQEFTFDDSESPDGTCLERVT